MAMLCLDLVRPADIRKPDREYEMTSKDLYGLRVSINRPVCMNTLCAS